MAYNIGTYIPAVPCQFFTDAGLVASGYKLFVYGAGGTTKVTTYTSADLAATNTNPIVLDAAGRCTIFLSPLAGSSYKFVLATPTTADPPTGGNIVWTRDAVGIMPASDSNIDVEGTAGQSLAEGEIVAMSAASGLWVKSNPAVAQLSVDSPRLGVVVSGGNFMDTIIVRIQGMSSAVPGLLTGTTYYLSATQGELTATAPTGTVHIVPFGYAPSSAALLFPVQSLYRVGARLALKSFGYSAGQSNAAGGGDTALTSYDVPIPANILDQPGACLVLEGSLSIAGNTDAKTFKARIDAATLITLWGSSANVANHVIPFRFMIYRRTSSTGSLTGIAYHGAGPAGAPANYLANSSLGAVDWTVGQTLHFFASANTVTSVTLTDLTVYPIRSYQGALV